MSWFADMDWIDYSLLLVILLMVSIAIGDYLESIFSWIKLQWKNAIPLKRVYIVVASIIGFALFILFCILYSQIFLVPLGISTLELSDIDSGFALAFLGTVTGGVALFSGFLAILRSEEDKNQNKIAKSQADTAIEQSKIANEQSKAANRQARTAEQGLITDRINKAVENLGKSENGIPVIEVRIGALYALERIAKDSERDHIQIIEILCAYIRTNSPNNIENDKRTRIREDIQEALTIIGRRETWSKNNSRLEIEMAQKMCIQFYNCYLKGVELYSANLSHANFYNANLQKSWLNDADLSYTRLLDVNINDAVLTGVKTNGAYARSGDFSGCKTLNQEQIDVMFLGKEVILRDDLIHPQKDSKYDKVYDNHNDFMEAYEEWLKDTGN